MLSTQGEPPVTKKSERRVLRFSGLDNSISSCVLVYPRFSPILHLTTRCFLNSLNLQKGNSDGTVLEHTHDSLFICQVHVQDLLQTNSPCIASTKNCANKLYLRQHRCMPCMPLYMVDSGCPARRQESSPVLHTVAFAAVEGATGVLPDPCRRRRKPLPTGMAAGHTGREVAVVFDSESVCCSAAGEGGDEEEPQRAGVLRG
jgi:hypothetical protein